MSFLLRAALVIGTLSYLAALRGEPGGPSAGLAPEPAGSRSTLRETLSAALPAAVPTLWNAMPQQAREGIAREALAELGRRPAAPVPSRDTLAETDRLTPWRGTAAR